MPAELIELVYNAFSDTAKTAIKSKIEKSSREQQLLDHLLKHHERFFRKHNQDTLDKELDYGGILDFMNNNFVENVSESFQENTPAQCKKRINSIRNEFRIAAKANNSKQKRIADEYFEKSLNIFFSHIRSAVDPEIVVYVNSQLYKNTNDEKTRIASPVTNQAEKDLNNSINYQIRYIKNQSIICSIPGYLTLNELVNEESRLYIEQEFQVNGTQKLKGIDNFYEKKRKSNLILTGEAGSGKSIALKKIFIDYSKNGNVLYITAKDYKNRNVTTALVKHIREIINGEQSQTESLIIIDGLDEAYADDPNKAAEVVVKASRCRNPVWFGCRSDYYRQVGYLFDGYVDSVATVEPISDDKNIKNFLEEYCRLKNCDTISDAVKLEKIELYLENDICRNPFNLSLFAFIVSEDTYYSVPKTKYELLDLFLSYWYKKEFQRQMTNMTETEFYTELYSIANDLYNGRPISLKTKETSIINLLSIKNGHVKDFIHWDFCVFLISKQIISAAEEGGIPVVDYFSQAFLDDVTNMTWEELNSTCPGKIGNIYKNLFGVYKLIYENNSEYSSLDAKTKCAIDNMDEKNKLKLKDEIIYFILRLPFVDSSNFFDYAFKKWTIQ